VVGDADLIKVHFHTNTPWKVLEYCATLGDIYDVVVENVSLVQNYRTQFSEILASGTPEELLETLRKKVKTH
jgi:dihydroxyacetone kinase-like predicted kinase